MNELGIVLVVLFALVLAFTVFNKGPKNLFRSKDSSDEHSEKNSVSEDTPELTDEHKDIAIPTPQKDSFKFDPAKTSADKAPVKPQTPQPESPTPTLAPTPNEYGGQHYTLEVEDPAMTGKVDNNAFPPLHDEPRFGKPEPAQAADASIKSSCESKAPKTSSQPEPQAFVLVVKSNQLIALERLQKIMQGLGAKLNEKNLYTYASKSMNREGYVLIANLLEPGDFTPNTQQPVDQTLTPGVVLILELPTFVTASAAMHDMIMLARKLVQHLDGTILNEQMQPVKESYLQSMRERSLEYDSRKIVS